MSFPGGVFLPAASAEYAQRWCRTEEEGGKETARQAEDGRFLGWGFCFEVERTGFAFFSLKWES